MTRKMVAKAFTSSCATGVALAAGRRELQNMRKLMKPFYCVLLCFVGCVFGASGGVPGSVIANGHTWSCSEAESSDESSSVTACIDGLLDDYPTGNLIVPNKAGGYTVTEVNLELYFVDNSLTGLTIPDTVKTMDLAVGEEANITSINLPSQLLYLKLDLPKLQSISLPSGLLELELHSDSLTSLTLPSKLARFWGGCPFVKTLNIPASCDDVELWGFSSLENITVEPSNPQYSDANNVLYNKEKTSLYFIGAKYTTFTVPDSVTRIYLMDKLNVTSLAIGKNVSKIGKSFEKCVPKLTSVTVDPANQYFCMYDGCLYDINLTTRYWGTPGGGSTVSLSTAIDNTTLSFTTGGNANWTGQTSVSHDEIDSARSGQISDSQTTYFQTTVSGGGTIEFWWKVSSESNHDKLHFYVDRQDAVNAISGDTGWVHVSHSLSSGSHTLKWAYEKDSSSSSGSDCGWVDQVVWTPQGSAGVTITFNANGGCFDPEGTRVSTWTKSVTSGSQYGSLPVPARSFYRFDGWYTSASGGTRISDSSAVSSSGHTLYAHWAEDFTTSITASAAEPIDVSDGLTPSYTKYPVVLLPGDGTGSPYLTHAVYERALIIPANRFSRTGYAFSGWKVYDACSGREPYYDYMGIGGGYVGEYSPGSTLEFCGSTVLVAQWRANTYTCTVTFDANGGSIGTSPKTTKTVESGSTLGCLEVAWRTGYQLDGWYTSPSGGSKISESTIVTSDVTYYAHWTAGYEVRLNLNGGSIGCTPEVWYVPSGSPVGEDLPDTVSRSGYAFAGWWTAAEGGEEITAATIVTHAITCYAHWFPMTFSSGEKWHYEPGNCWRSGHIDANGSTYAIMTVTGPGSIYFEWKTSSESNYDKLHFYVNGNEQLPAISGETDWIPETFKFTGTGSLTLKWEYTKYSSTDSGLDCGWIKNVVWTPTTMCTVTFNPNGGSVSPTTKSVESGSVIGPLPTPEWLGHSFGGWYTSANGGNSIDEDTPVTGNVTYYAHWTASTYTVTFNANGGSVSPASKAVTYDSTYGDLPPPTRIGYKFDGWYTSASGGTKVVSSTKVTITSNQTLYAHWAANSYTVTLNANGGSVSPKWITIAYDSPVGRLPTPTWEDDALVFDGWWTARVGGKKIDENTIVTGDVTYWAHWKGLADFTIVNGVLKKVELNGVSEVVIPDGVTSIGAQVFSGCTGLTRVTIPSGVTVIGHRAFYGCTGLTSITMPDGVKTIDNYAFYNCVSLASLDMPDSVTYIGEKAFYGCKRLDDMRMSANVASIGNEAFNGTPFYDNQPDGLVVFGEVVYKMKGACPSNVMIPDGVRRIGCYAFSSCAELESVTISGGVMVIGEFAFYGCTGITNVTIPDGVTRIAEGAFYGCSGLSSVAIPDGVSYIGMYAFQGCSGLVSVAIPKSETGIGYRAFYGCTGLTSVTIPDGVKYIGDYAFYNCSKLTGLTIPDSVTSVGAYAFSGCSSLASLKIPDGVISIGENAFDGVPFYENHADGLVVIGKVVYKIKGDCPAIVTIPNGVTSIGSGAFSGCSSLTSVTIPSSVTNIGEAAFSDCSALVSVNIPYGVTSIADSAFGHCSGLKSLTIPDSVTAIGEFAFSGCNGLADVTIPDGVTSIGRGAFEGCSSLTSLEIPDRVTYIGSYAFNACSGLTSLTIPDGVTRIGSYAFYSCSGLTSVTVPDHVKQIEEYTFFNCRSLVSVTITDGVTRIGNYAFQYCSSLASVRIPSSVKSIGKYAFDRCAGLASAVISDGVESIGDCAFENCTSLSSLTIPDSVAEIGENAFEGCRGLNSVTIGSGVKNLNNYVFRGCSGLTSVTIPDNVTIIGSYAFFGCSGLTSVTIPNSVTIIGYSTFEGCSRLTNVVIPDGVTSIGTSMFEGCSSLTDVTIPEGVTSIGSWAFHNTALANVHVAPGDAARIRKLIEDSHYYAGSVRFLGDLTYTVTFNANGGSVSPATRAVGRGLAVGSLPTPTLKGYAHAGWWTAPEGGERIDASAIVSHDITYYAHWNLIVPEFTIVDGVLAKAQLNGLSEIVIPDGVTSIGRYAFSGCSGLTSVTIPDSVTDIGDGAFYGCSGLTSVTIPDSVTNIGESAFYGCSGLADEQGWVVMRDTLWGYFGNDNVVTIPDGVTSIGRHAFSGFSGLTSVTIPASVTSIGNSAFYGCSGLASVTIPDSVTSIGGYAFYGCSGLTSVRIGDGVTSIGWYAFDGCSGLARVVIPDSVTSIGEYAFSSRDSRESVTLLPRTINLGSYAFACKTLKNVYASGELKGTFEKSVFPTAAKIAYGTVVQVYAEEGQENMGTVSGYGAYQSGKNAALKATPGKGYVFVGWYDGGRGTTVLPGDDVAFLSKSPSYSYPVPNAHAVIVARFAKGSDDAVSLKVNVADVTTEKDGSISLDLGACVESLSLPKLTVSGLPAGVKYDAKTGIVSGKATKPGVYKVTVSATNATVKQPVTATFDIVVPNLVSEKLPGLEQETDAYGVVTCGVAFDPGLVDCSPEDGWTVKAAGLPTGLKFVQDKATEAYSITGVPTKPGTFTVTFTASKKGEKNQVATITLVTEALPEWAVGTFSGFVEHSSGAGSGSDFGSVTMTVAANGKVSGKMALVGTNYTFSAASYAMVTDDGYFVVEADAKAGKVVRPLRLLVIPCDAPKATPSLLNARAVGSLDSPFGSEILMCRGMWKDKPTAAAAKTEIAKWEGVYTLSMSDGGYLSLTVGKDGNVKAAGKLADGTSVSATTPLLYDGETGFLACVYSAPSAYKGGSLAMSIGFDEGEGGVRTLGNSRGIARWTSRNPQATGEYGEGFSRDVDFSGAYYDKLQKLNAYYESLRVSLDGAPKLGYVYKETDINDLGRKVTVSENREADAVDTLWQDGLTATVNEKGAFVVEKATKPVQDKETKEWSYDGTNDGALTLSFTQATGIFKGSYTFWYDYESAHDNTTGKSTMSHTSKKVSFEGIMVQGENEMRGFYLWDASSAYDDPKTGKEKTYKYKESYPVRLER